MRFTRGKTGSAAVEQAALAALIAAIVAITGAAIAAAPGERGARELAGTIGRRIACAPRYPVPCNRHPLALAYGFPVGKLVRLLAPAPQALPGPGGEPLWPVDFRRCRRASCAASGEGRPGLTGSRRRFTAFTSVSDLRRSGGPIRISYWLYRPGLGWEAIRRDAGESELAAAAPIRLRVSDIPALVPLETLAERNHARFATAEQPPWQASWAEGSDPQAPQG